VLVDVAVMLAYGGEAIGDINMLRHQGQVLGHRGIGSDGVARPGRTDSCGVEADPGGPGQDAPSRVSKTCQRCRRSQAAGTDLGKVVVLDVDATLVTSHSEKEHAAPTFKSGFAEGGQRHCPKVKAFRPFWVDSSG